MSDDTQTTTLIQTPHTPHSTPLARPHATTTHARPHMLFQPYLHYCTELSHESLIMHVYMTAT